MRTVRNLLAHRLVLDFLIALALGLALDGCGGEGPVTSQAWSLEEDLRIGAVASDGPDQFGYVADVLVDPARRLWVIDGPSHQIRIFDADGTFVRTVGQRGQGPGGLELPTSLDDGPDYNIWVADSRNGRWEVFDTAGASVGSYSFSPGMMQVGDAWGMDGLLYTHVWLSGGPQPREVLVRRRLDGERLVPEDTFPAPQPDRGETADIGFIRDGKRMSLIVPIPFQALRRRLLVAGEGWWLSHPGPRYRLSRTDLAGDTILVIERDYDPVAVTEEDRVAALADLPPDHGLAAEDLPAWHPPVMSLWTLPDGHLFVRRRGPDGEVFDVFDSAGSFASSIPIPDPSLQVLTARDDALYGVVRNEMDVPFVVRMRIHREGSSAARR